MPDIDLPPSKYRWRRPLSKPLAWGFVAVGLVMLALLFWNREAISRDNLVIGASLVAACVGVLLGNLLKDVD